MTTPIRINTAFGQKEFHILQEQYNFYHKNDKLKEFQNRCKEDYMIQSKYLEYFLFDPDLSKKYPMNENDDEGFKIFNEQSDIISSLKYFAERKNSVVI